MTDKTLREGLNPCFNGICSASVSFFIKCAARRVLILVLMEYALREEISNLIADILRLNPCFNGICSASKMRNLSEIFSKVLILVLMEYALRDSHTQQGKNI